MTAADDDPRTRALALVTAVRDACARAAAAAYEDAGVQGLCEEGRWEAALGAIRSLDPPSLLAGSDPAALGDAAI